jgi:hypothetical protein
MRHQRHTFTNKSLLFDFLNIASEMVSTHDALPLPVTAISSAPTLSPPLASRVKVRWTPDEDLILAGSVPRQLTPNWPVIAQLLPGRTGKQCRERWVNKISPMVNRKTWADEEDAILIDYQREHGNEWAQIARLLPGRSPTHVKNRWQWLKRHFVVGARRSASADKGESATVRFPVVLLADAETQNREGKVLFPELRGITVTDIGSEEERDHVEEWG